MVNPERLAKTFAWLVQIDSVSREEGRICQELGSLLETFGAETVVDGAAVKVGGETGNLIAKFKGAGAVPPLLFNAHMDTVEPGRGVIPVLSNGVFTSRGDTILGADDKSAIAILLETIQILQEQKITHGPLELVFTVCEEIGLQGAKNLDFSLIQAPYGYALDATDTQGIVLRAPGANRLTFKVHGQDAHAGAAPEKGINAIMLAGRALAGLQIGRIDTETTCNIGVIEGGTATNIVPKQVTVKGEVRSHDEDKLTKETDRIVAAFQSAVDQYEHPSAEGLPRLEALVERDFCRTFIPEDHAMVSLARSAAANLGRRMTAKISGGGADANVFFGKGIMTGVLGTGMRDMHTVRESVALSDMVQTVELLIEIIRLHALPQAAGRP